MEKVVRSNDDLICKDCNNTFLTNQIVLEGSRESCPHCGNNGNIWDLATQVL